VKQPNNYTTASTIQKSNKKKSVQERDKEQKEIMVRISFFLTPLEIFGIHLSNISKLTVYLGKLHKES